MQGTALGVWDKATWFGFFDFFTSPGWIDSIYIIRARLMHDSLIVGAHSSLVVMVLYSPLRGFRFEP